MTNRALPWRWELHWQILLGMAVGAAAGWGMGFWAVGSIPAGTAAERAGAVAAEMVRGTWGFRVVQLVGELFLRGLQLVVVPLVVSSVVLAVVNIGSRGNFGRLGGKALAYYMATSLAAILIGLTLVSVVEPGIGSDGRGILLGRDLAALGEDQAAVERRTAGRGAGDFLDVFRQMVPPNLTAAAADNGQLLGLIVVAMVAGYFLSRLRTDGRPLLVAFTRGVYDLTMAVTGLVLRLAPLGVMGLVAATVAEQHARLAPEDRLGEFARGIGLFAVMVLVALVVHFAGTMALVLGFVARVNPLRHYRAMAPALVTAFSTASSSATLPVTMRCVEKRAGVSEETASFVLPLGATVNMDGTALYECVAAIFICQAFGVDLTIGQQFMVVVVALLTSVGVAGVPAASLVAIVVILNAVQGQLPEAAPALLGGMGLLMVFERPLDMCRTAVNIFGDSVGAVTIARSEGERTVLGDSGAPARVGTPMAQKD